MTVVDQPQLKTNQTDANFLTKLAAIFRALFGSSTVASRSTRFESSDMIREETEEGSFIVAPCGYRVRVPQAAESHSSLGEMVSNVRDGLAIVPPLPSVVIELMKEIQNPNATATSVGNIAASDPGMAASLIRTVNSAAFGLTRKITSVSEAVNYLGFSMVKSMVLRLQLDVVLGGKAKSNDDVLDLWIHSLIVSYIGDVLAKRVAGVDRGFVATLGLLHDIGKLAVHTQFPNESKMLRDLIANGENDEGLLAREARVLGVDHAELGANLVSKWGLPGDLVKAIRWHHAPSRAFEPCDPKALHQAMTILQIANQLAKYCYVYSDQTEVDEISPEMLSQVGFGPDITGLLDAEVCLAASRAILLADDGGGRPVTSVHRFIRLNRGETGAAVIKALAETPAGASQISVNDELCEAIFNRDSGHKISQMNAAANEAGGKSLLSDVQKKAGNFPFPDQVRTAVGLVTRCVLANALTHRANDRIVIGLSDIGGCGQLAIRAESLGFTARFGADCTTALGARALELELANILNLGWFDSIATSTDGATIVFTAKKV